jgi:ubiquinone/menaquinone biosynthesis C-methylase UbiE
MHKSHTGEYTLATGKAAVRRLKILHRVYAPAGRRVLLQAGVAPGMEVADFGCGVGEVTRMLAEMVGPSGRVVGIDLSAAQLEQAREICKTDGVMNATFVEASAYSTGLPRNSFDVAYCRFLLLHLTDPATALQEMRAVLKPGGLLVIEDGNLHSAGSTPPSSLRAFADLFEQLGPIRSLNYALSENLYHLVRDAGFPEPSIEIHQPAIARGEGRLLQQLSVEEIGPACIDAGLLTDSKLKAVLADMERDTNDPDILVLMPRMSQVWARKPV